jgi:O-antigen ligase
MNQSAIHRPRIPGAPYPAARARKPSDNKFAIALVTLNFWVLVVRVIVPGMFDYDPNLDYKATVARDALINQITWITFIAIGALFTLMRSKETIRVLRATNPFYLLMVGFAVVSVTWSIDQGASTARLIHLLTLILCCLAVMLIGWNPRKLQQAMLPVLTIMLVGSLIFGLVSPDLAIEAPIYPETKSSWHGLCAQKNSLGALASFGVVFWFHAWVTGERKLWLALPIGGICAACLILSRSSTSLMASVLVCCFMFLLVRSSKITRRYFPYAVGGFVILTLTYLMAVLKIVPGADILLLPITAITGKDATFTGRTEIWFIVRQHIALAPLLGTGYGGYWVGPLENSPSYVFLNIMYFYPFESHNGYLDIINDLGYVGFLILLGFIWWYVRQALAFLKVNHAQAALYLAVLFQQLLTNLSESHWWTIRPDFVILTLATFCLARESTTLRRASQSLQTNAATSAISRKSNGMRNRMRVKYMALTRPLTKYST